MALTQTRAEERFACLQQESISYRFHLALYPGKEYEGLSELEFTLINVPAELTIDSKAKKITKLVVNGAEHK